MSRFSQPGARAAFRSILAAAVTTAAGAAHAGNDGFEPLGIVASLLRWLFGGG